MTSSDISAHLSMKQERLSGLLRQTHATCTAHLLRKIRGYLLTQGKEAAAELATNPETAPLLQHLTIDTLRTYLNDIACRCFAPHDGLFMLDVAQSLMIPAKDVVGEGDAPSSPSSTKRKRDQRSGHNPKRQRVVSITPLDPDP